MIQGIRNSDIKNLFNPENVFVAQHGGGAGNNWASGYHQGEQVQEDILDMIGALRWARCAWGASALGGGSGGAAEGQRRRCGCAAARRYPGGRLCRQYRQST